MADTFAKRERSRIMRAVKSHGNKSTELKLIGLFRKFGIKGWRRNYPLKGNPDFVFPKKRIAVFADGCFWHGHNCRNTKPASNKEYWRAKIARNKKRDKTVVKYLRSNNWSVIRIWECRIAAEKLPRSLISLIS
jgi:DNA mismatch endonuclease (patch repair protein)